MSQGTILNPERYAWLWFFTSLLMVGSIIWTHFSGGVVDPLYLPALAGLLFLSIAQAADYLKHRFAVDAEPGGVREK